jgi:signal transduction histidine kinase/PAS domain-containing protein
VLRRWVARLPERSSGADTADSGPVVLADVPLARVVAGPLAPDVPVPALPAVSTLRVPLFAQEDVIGALTLYRVQPGPGFALPDIARGQELALMLALAMDRSAMQVRQEQAAKQVKALTELALALGYAQTPEAVAEQVAAAFLTILGARAVAVYRLKPDRLTVERLGGAGDEDPADGWRSLQDDPALAQAVATACPVVVSPLGRCHGLPATFRRPAIPGGDRGALPFLVNGDVIGVVSVRCSGHCVVDELEWQCLAAILELCAQAITRTCLDEAVGRHEAELRRITDSLPALVAFVDTDLRYRRVNRAHELWFARDRAGLTGQPLYDVLGEATFLQILPHLESAMSGTGAHFEAQIRFPGKGLCWVDALFVPSLGPEGRVDGFTVLIHDITSRHFAADMAWFLAEVGRLLSTSLDIRAALQDVARLTTGQLADWCAFDLIGPDGTIDRVVGVHGDPDRQEAATALDARFRERPRLRRLLQRLVAGGETLRVPALSEAVMAPWQPDAAMTALLTALHPHAALFVPLRVRGTVIGMMTLVSGSPDRSFTPPIVSCAEGVAVRAAYAVEHARLFEAEQQAREAAERAVTLRDDFLSVASHELRTPVTSLLLQIDVIQRRLATLPDTLVPEWLGGRLDDARGSVQRLTALVTCLLDVSCLQEGKMTLEAERLDAGVVVRDVVARYRDDLARVGSPVHLAIEPDLSGVWDRLRLEQVVTNLLTNAITYGRGRPITVGARRQAETVVIRVADRGIGIAPEERSRLFQRFGRLSSTRGGFGLGLWIVREIVTLLGGRIDVDSEPGVGSEFWVTLPIQPG